MNEMKFRHVLVVSGVVVPLLFLQLSCATVEKQPAEGPTVATEAAAEEAGLLAEIHNSAGITCGGCHAESPPAGAAPKDVCLSCHADYKELTAAMYGDPHNAHMMYPDCGDCHHVHRPGELQCLACHDF